MLHRSKTVRLILGYLSKDEGDLIKDITEHLEAHGKDGLFAWTTLYLLLWSGLVQRVMPPICAPFRSWNPPYETLPATPFYRYSLSEKGKEYVKRYKIK